MSAEQTSAPYGIPPEGYRLPGGTHLGSVHLQVSDLQRSIGYYRDVLGFAVLSQQDGQAALGVADGAPLIVLAERRGAKPVPRGGAFGLFHFAILLPERAHLARFVQHLADAGVYAGMSDHAVSEAIYLNDPDGLGIEVYADRPRPTWQHHDRQLVMTTVPLNMRSLLAEAGNAQWSRMPPGTVIGHVHLHVGDLDDAAAFYHSALGFDKVVWDYPGALFVSAGGYHHHLGTNTWSRGPSAADDQARLLSWDLVVPRAEDAAAAARSLARAGYTVTEEGSGAWLTNDPWGTTLRITADASPASLTPEP